jgi:hypothetical protein
MEARQRFKDQQPLKPYFEEEISVLAALLEKAAKAGEIRGFPDCQKLAIRIRKGLIGYHPPFALTLSKGELEEEAGWMVDVLLRGISAS